MELIVKLPDIIALTPFTDTWLGCNPHYSRSSKQSTEWMIDYGVLSCEKRTKLIKTSPDLLGAYTHPYADPKGLRLASDFATILFSLDEFTDEQSAEDVRATHDTFTKALTGNSGDDSSSITLFTKDFLERLTSEASEDLQTRFVKNCIDYLDATAREAGLRSSGKWPPFEEYVQLRRLNGGVLPSFEMVEASLGFTLPQEVHNDATFQELVFAAVDVICLSNDIYSFEMEHTSGNDFCNAVSSLMHDGNLSPQGAIDRTTKIYQQRCADMTTSKLTMPSFGSEVDEMIRKYAWALEQWVCGYNAWQIKTGRFFGDKSKEVNATGISKFVPRTPIGSA